MVNSLAFRWMPRVRCGHRHLKWMKGQAEGTLRRTKRDSCSIGDQAGNCNSSRSTHKSETPQVNRPSRHTWTPFMFQKSIFRMIIERQTQARPRVHPTSISLDRMVYTQWMMIVGGEQGQSTGPRTQEKCFRNGSTAMGLERTEQQCCTPAKAALCKCAVRAAETSFVVLFN